MVDKKLGNMLVVLKKGAPLKPIRKELQELGAAGETVVQQHALKLAQRGRRDALVAGLETLIDLVKEEKVRHAKRPRKKLKSKRVDFSDPKVIARLKKKRLAALARAKAKMGWD